MLLDNLIKFSSQKVEIGKLKIQAFWGATPSTEKQVVNFPEPFETTCLSVIVTTRNDGGSLPSYDVFSYNRTNFTFKSDVAGVSTWVTSIGY